MLLGYCKRPCSALRKALVHVIWETVSISLKPPGIRSFLSSEASVPPAFLGGSPNATKGFNVSFREANLIVKHQQSLVLISTNSSVGLFLSKYSLSFTF